MHRLSPEELCEQLGTSIENGLSEQKVSDRLAEYGKNELNPPKEDSIHIWWYFPIMDTCLILFQVLEPMITGQNNLILSS